MKMPPESAPYDDLVEATGINKRSKAKASSASRKKTVSSKVVEPKSLAIKVHFRDKRDCDDFAQLLQRDLSSREKTIAFSQRNKSTIRVYEFTDTRSKSSDKKPSRKAKKKKRGYDDFYDRHWREMPDFSERSQLPFFSLRFTFKSVRLLQAFARLVKQKIAFTTKSIWYPELERQDLESQRWKSDQKKKMRYPVYIISKGRAQTRLTARTLEELKIPYFMVIEKQDYDAYSCVIEKKRILVLPFEGNHGQGPGRARNWCWDHAVANGHGVTQDYQEALVWYRKAAEKGNAQAQANLAVMYASGQGVAQDYKEAVVWVRKAAEQGVATAQFNLGVSYRNGQGVAQDYVYSHMWYNITASNGDKVAEKNRDELAKIMTSADISKAQELARECVKKNYKGC